jgi:flagellar biosynthesis protein FlhG
MTPEPTSITDSYSLLKALNRHSDFSRETTTIKVVTNKVSDYEAGVNLYNKISVVVSKFLNINMEFLGYIVADDNMSKAIIQQKPICMAYPNSTPAKCFEKLSASLLDIKIEEVPEKSLVQVFLRRFKKNK